MSSRQLPRVPPSPGPPVRSRHPKRFEGRRQLLEVAAACSTRRLRPALGEELRRASGGMEMPVQPTAPRPRHGVQRERGRGVRLPTAGPSIRAPAS